jgi:hypothetical protein
MSDENAVDPEVLGTDPRKWAHEFVERLNGRRLDETLVFGWFAEALRIGAENAEIVMQHKSYKNDVFVQEDRCTS